MTRDDAAARAEGHAVETLVLRGVARRQIRGLGRRLPVADGHARDARRRRRVGLEQRRRDRQRPGDVVEAVRGVVRRQQRGDVDPQVEQIANGVGVLRPVQPVQDHRPGLDSRRRAAIDLGLEPVAQPVVFGQRRPRDVGRRHHAGAQLADHFFPELRVLADACVIQILKREVRRLHARAVARHAVAIDDCLLLFCCGRSRRGRGHHCGLHVCGPSARERRRRCVRRAIGRCRLTVDADDRHDRRGEQEDRDAQHGHPGVRHRTRPPHPGP